MNKLNLFRRKLVFLLGSIDKRKILWYNHIRSKKEE